MLLKTEFVTLLRDKIKETLSTELRVNFSDRLEVAVKKVRPTQIGVPPPPWLPVLTTPVAGPSPASRTLTPDALNACFGPRSQEGWGGGGSRTVQFQTGPRYELKPSSKSMLVTVPTGLPSSSSECSLSWRAACHRPLSLSRVPSLATAPSLLTFAPVP